jgi:hypothetical protein
MAIRPRDVVTFEFERKYRTGVVLRVADTTAKIVFCSTKARDFPHVLVRSRSQDAIALRLPADSYFYEGNYISRGVAELTPKLGAHCSPRLWIELTKLTERIAATEAAARASSQAEAAPGVEARTATVGEAASTAGEVRDPKSGSGEKPVGE